MYDITKVAPTQIEETPVITTEMVYVKRVDMSVSGSNDIIYKGWAVPGTTPASALWRLVRLTINTEGDVTEEWADGNTDFDNIWNDRLTKGYN
jgi:hypothetical protein